MTVPSSDHTGYAATVARVRKVLATEYACPECAFLQDGVLITPSETRAGQRRFPRPIRPLLIVTMGQGVVATCHPERLGWLTALLSDRSRDDIFSPSMIAALATAIARDGQRLQGPVIRLVCASQTLRAATPPEGVMIDLVIGASVRDLYHYEGFHHALSYRSDHPRPDVMATVAWKSGNVLGIAAASEDSGELWQIGIDVAAAHRGAGIGRALVGRLTEAVCRAGKVPYYSAAVSNVRSLALATNLGYWPLWTELYAVAR
jgi:GNAT superfamily N-acetyltransferase